MTEADLRSALEVLTTPPDAPELESAHPELPAAVASTQSWLRGPGVMGVGLAEKTTRGERVDELALKVYVVEKRPPDAVAPEERVPDTVAVPSVADAVTTDVEAIGTQRLELNTTRVRPLAAGFSIGIADETGTLGCFVRLKTDPDGIYIMSNSHVLAKSGLAAVGTAIVQPGPSDGAGDPVAALTASVAFDFQAGFNNLCDAAVAKLAASEATPSVAIPEIGVPKASHVELARGMTIQKTGRTTGHTIGTIRDVDYRTFMNYPRPGGGFAAAGFRSQVLCERYSDAGDSGSLVCDSAGNAVGLHWCGSASASVFSPIDFVLEGLGAELIVTELA
jgi:hypothetical protein